MGREAELEGDSRRIAKLAQTEARLGIRFPHAYRQFIAERPKYFVAIKHVRLFPVERCHWLFDDAGPRPRGNAVVIGQGFSDTAPLLVFKRASAKGDTLGEAVYESVGARLKRAPDFSEFVSRAVTFVPPTADARVQASERLAGIARLCPRCGSELRVGQLCGCGHIGAATDPKLVLSAEAIEELKRQFPALWTAWSALRQLKDAGQVVPTGSAQVSSLAEALERGASPAEAGRQLAAAWKAKGLKVTVDAAALARAIEAGNGGASRG